MVSHCAGISNGALIVAGCAHFRDPFLQGGRKIWTDSTYVLTSSAHEWEGGFTLARPAGCAVAAQWEDEVICAGGGNAVEHFMEVIALRWDGGSILQRLLPALPQPRAFVRGPGETRVSTAMAVFASLVFAGNSTCWSSVQMLMRRMRYVTCYQKLQK